MNAMPKLILACISTTIVFAACFVMLRKAMLVSHQNREANARIEGKTEKARRKSRVKMPASTVMASWYGREFSGKRMANGWLYNPGLLTCASNAWPLGSVLKVCRGKRWVLVRVTDRMGSEYPARVLDLSEAAAQRLGMLRTGVCPVTVLILRPTGGK